MQSFVLLLTLAWGSHSLSLPPHFAKLLQRAEHDRDSLAYDLHTSPLAALAPEITYTPTKENLSNR